MKVATVLNSTSKKDRIKASHKIQGEIRSSLQRGKQQHFGEVGRGQAEVHDEAKAHPSSPRQSRTGKEPGTDRCRTETRANIVETHQRASELLDSWTMIKTTTENAVGTQLLQCTGNVTKPGL